MPALRGRLSAVVVGAALAAAVLFLVGVSLLVRGPVPHTPSPGQGAATVVVPTESGAMAASG